MTDKKKMIIIISHQLTQGLQKIKLENGDEYDSEIRIYDYTGQMLYRGVCNVDSSKKYPDRKIEIINIDYLAICFYRKIDQKALLIYCADDKIDKNIKHYWQVPSKCKRLPTKEPNPIHNNENWAENILIHSGGLTWDGSAGCITIHPKDYKKFMSCFIENEKVKVMKRKDYNDFYNDYLEKI